MRNRDTMLETVRNLLKRTQANGATEAEEMTALDMARAMMDAHAITDEDLQLTKEEGAILRDESEKDPSDPHGIKWRLSYAVGEFCGVEIYRHHGVFKFCGGRSDCDFAEFLLCDHLLSYVTTELYKHLIGCFAPRRERRTIIRNFVEGCCDRISDRLLATMEKSVDVQTDNSKALVVIQKQAIAAKLKECDIKLRTCGGGSRGNFNEAAYGAGRATGERATFGRPVSGPSGALRIAGR